MGRPERSRDDQQVEDIADAGHLSQTGDDTGLGIDARDFTADDGAIAVLRHGDPVEIVGIRLVQLGEEDPPSVARETRAGSV
ncbi:hypothetical protein [Methylorubrum aminovorans]|uniref:hypothetical protein n=1 Tax=Methylorubrum aminovorans TaxID=269069 RepID=UPI001EDFAFA1|nr:hypothetical protein [Methylorubrum aminovorans]